MFRSVVSRFIPSFGSRFASTMVSTPLKSATAPSPIFSALSKNINEPKSNLLNTYIEKVEPSLNITEMIMTSVLRKRRLKMKKHKLRKRRKAQRALRIKIGK